MAAAFVSQRRRRGLTLVKPQPWTARMKEGKFGLGKKSGRTFFEKLSVSGMRKLSPFGVKWTHSCSESLASMLPRRARRQRQGAPIRAPSMRGTYSYNFSMKLAGCLTFQSCPAGGDASPLWTPSACKYPAQRSSLYRLCVTRRLLRPCPVAACGVVE